MFAWVKRHWFGVLSAVAMLAFVVVAIVLLKRVLSISPQDKNAVPALAAGIALTGVLVTAGATVVGYLLRQSIDVRTARLAESASHRSQMQAALDTVKYLAVDPEKPETVVQASAALLVLRGLDELAMAMDLAAEMWPKGLISASTGVAIVDDGISSKQAELQVTAAVLLFNNWRELQLIGRNGQAPWPSSLQRWPEDLDPEARRLVTLLVTAWLKEDPPKVTNEFRLALVPRTTGVAPPHPLPS